jgi:hypothetical protein
VDVTVTNPDEQPVVLKDGYTYTEGGKPPASKPPAAAQANNQTVRTEGEHE